VGDWCRRRKEFEARDYRGAKRGRAPDEQKLLQPKDERALKKIIETKTPDQAGLPYALWTRKAISALAKKCCGVVVTSRRVSRYTKRWGLTPQRPAKYAYEQDAKAIRVWLTETYPAIVKRAKQENADIHWEDETGVSLSTFYARSYAPKGKTPMLRLPAKRAALSMISSITNRGDLRFMLYHGALHTDLFLSFLERLVKDTDRKIFLIVDNLRVHKAKKVKRWEALHREKIELFSPTALCATVQS
jgi:transposase